MTSEEFCPNCEEYRKTRMQARTESYDVRGRNISISIQVKVCETCGQNIGSDTNDQEILEAVYAEYRHQEDLLTPEKIRGIRKRYQLSQKSLAVLLGMSEASINRYERGGVQDKAHDAAIRACENPQFIRDLLQRKKGILSAWQLQRAESALAGQAGSVEQRIEQFRQIDRTYMPTGISINTGFRRFDDKRFAAVVIWFCGRLGGVYTTVINKLLFYADFLSFKSRTVSLTGAAYRRIELGPVLADYGRLLSWMESEDLLSSEEVSFPKGFTGTRYHPGSSAKSVDVDFSAQELKILEFVANELGNHTAKAISNRSHKEPAYLQTPDKQLISYQGAENLSLSLPPEADSSYSD
ncbi:MAG: DUF4065 domain-containing protein [Sedimentisphaerales bacterium]|nr:DUF4065 domain-containing protein [Sedimentisphaerales bacterium]